MQDRAMPIERWRCSSWQAQWYVAALQGIGSWLAGRSISWSSGFSYHSQRTSDDGDSRSSNWKHETRNFIDKKWFYNSGVRGGVLNVLRRQPWYQGGSIHSILGRTLVRTSDPLSHFDVNRWAIALVFMERFNKPLDRPAPRPSLWLS